MCDCWASCLLWDTEAATAWAMVCCKTCCAVAAASWPDVEEVRWLELCEELDWLLIGSDASICGHTSWQSMYQIKPIMTINTSNWSLKSDKCFRYPKKNGHIVSVLIFNIIYFENMQLSCITFWQPKVSCSIPYL